MPNQQTSLYYVIDEFIQKISGWEHLKSYWQLANFVVCVGISDDTTQSE